MTSAAVAADFDQSLNVQSNVSSQVALNNIMVFNVFAQFGSILFGQIFDTDVGVDTGRCKNVFGGFLADTVNIGQADFDALFSG